MNSLKSIILSITLLFSISNSHATSQQEQETLSYLKNSFSQVDIKRISRISQEMSLDIPTAEKFWPRYQEYLHRLIALRDKQLLGGFGERQVLGRGQKSVQLGHSGAASAHGYELHS